MPSSDKSSTKPRAAYLEQADEDDNPVPRSKRTASLKKKSDKDKKTKAKSQSDSGYSSHAANAGLSDASSPPLSSARPTKEESSQEERLSRRKSTSGSPTKSARKSSKPPQVHRNPDRVVNFENLPTLAIPFRTKNDPSFYGISPNSSTPVTGPSPRTTTLPNSSKPARPQSYYAGMPQPSYDNRPPQARSAYYIAPTPVFPPATSYPPATSPYSSWMSQAAFAQPQPEPYFSNQGQPRSTRSLADRFGIRENYDPIERTKSTSGVKELAQAFYDQAGYEEEQPTIRRRWKEAEDLRQMPPPTMPSIRRRVTTTDSRNDPRPFAPLYPDDLVEEERFDRRMSRSIRPEDAYRRRTSTSRNRSYTYDNMGAVPLRAPTPVGRPSSFYEDEAVPRFSTAKDKVQEHNATRYQEDMAGGPTINLTAEALRRVQRPSVSSRSTRSSKDDSEFKKSATTRTTMSRQGQDNDVIVKVIGNATLNVDGAEMKLADGAEVNFSRRKSIRNGSERSGSSEYGTIDDRQSRSGRPMNLSRSTSKSGYSDTFGNPWRPPRNLI